MIIHYIIAHFWYNSKIINISQISLVVNRRATEGKSMGILVQDKEKRSDLQNRITADLRAKTQASRQDDVDLVEDAEYSRNLKKTGRFAWVWFVLVFLAIVSVVIIIVG